MATTIRDVARAAGVSIATVSHALSGKRAVSEATRSRVRTSAARLNYRPNHVAASMVTGRTRTIGVIVPDIANPFFSELVRAAEGAAASRDYVLLVASSELDAALEDRSVDVMYDKRADALLYLPGTPGHHPSLDSLVAAGTPLVIIDEALPSAPAGASVITTDNDAGGALAAGHLAELGHRQIAAIGGPRGLPTAQARLAGFRRAARAAGITLERGRVRAAGAYTRAEGADATTLLLRDDPDVTALFCANDLIALGALEAARALGLEVPNDLSVIGFDDIFVSQLVSPPLTTVRQPIGLLGREAANLAMDLIEGATPTQRWRVLDVELVVRASTAPPKAR
jgi:LacI family transcriptional regulator